MSPRGAREKWWLLALGLLAAALVAGVAAFTVKYLSRPRPVEVALARVEAGFPVEVYLGGAVEQEGIYSVGADTALGDVLRRAGITLSDDGLLRVRVTVLGAGQEALPGAGEQGQSGRTNINTAGIAELDGLPGIGPSKAQAIVDYRNRNGLFRTIDDLLNVPGIGAQTLERMRGLITVID